MAKKIRTVLTIQLPAGKATPAPPVGTVLGPHGINIVEFCKTYNERTAAQAGQVIPAQITIFEDRSFTFVLQTPPAADLLRKAAGVEKGSATAGREGVGRVSRDQVREIAQIKMADLNANDIEAGARVIEGTARSMGIEVVELAGAPARGVDLHEPRQEVPGGGQARRARAGLRARRSPVGLLAQTSTVGFDPTVEAHIRLGVDPRHADQMVRGTVVLPHGTGKRVRVVVFAQGEKAQEALHSGADEVGGEDLVKKMEGGWLDFDVALATPDMMGMVGKLGKILGRRGLMPNPKSGTITFDLERAIREVKAGRVEFKVDKGGIIHVPFGKASFEEAQLADNLATLIDAINRARPSATKGQYFRSLTVASSMGPGIKVDVPALLARAA